MPAWGRFASVGLIALAAQTPQFRSGIDVVRFDVVVLDKARHPVAGLAAEDFHVTEDGRPLRIAGFQAVTIAEAAPLPAPSPATAGGIDRRRETVTNRVDAPGRLVVILMDRSIPNEGPIVTARKIANAAIDALGANDFGAVLFTSGITGNQPQGFTRDRERLRSAIASAQMGASADVQMTPGGMRRGGPGLGGGSCYCGLCSMERLTTIVEELAPAQDYHKMIVYIGDSLPLSDSSDQSGPSECRGRFRTLYDRLLHAIDRSNVTIHSFNPRGLDTGALGADAFRGDSRETASARMEREGNLATLPEYTGGRAVMNTNEPERLVPAIFDESRTYYVLAVERGPARKEGHAHAVRISVSRPDAIVATRSAYFDAAPVDRANTPSDPLERAVGELLPRPDVPLHMTLAPGSAKGSTIDVTLSTPLSTAARADVLVGVFDEFARQVGSERARVELPVREGADTEWTMHLNPKPGRYEVRAAVKIGDAIGSVTGNVEVTAEATPHEEPHGEPKKPADAAASRSAALDALLARASAYLTQYTDPSNGLLLDEDYTQQAGILRNNRVRNLKSELLILADAAEGWVEFRDVVAVDGKPIADRADRLLQIFSATRNDPRGQGRRLTEEGARYNLDSDVVRLKRTLNHPMIALLYLLPANQPRSVFEMLGGPGGDTQHVSLVETSKPALIGTAGGDTAKGDFWIDRTTGYVRRAELRIVSRSPAAIVSATFRIRYDKDPKTGAMLPSTMEEHYEVHTPRGGLLDIIEGQAKYSNPRQFRVSTGGG